MSMKKTMDEAEKLVLEHFRIATRETPEEQRFRLRHDVKYLQVIRAFTKAVADQLDSDRRHTRREITDQVRHNAFTQVDERIFREFHFGKQTEDD